VIPDAVTMPQFFSEHGGYRTESIGKVFHIGHGNEGDPQSFNVPHFKDKVIEYLDPESTDGGKLTREEAFFTNQQLDRIKSLPRGAAFESPVAEDMDYADGRVAVECKARLRAAKQRREKEGTPFFIAVGFVRPHLPFSAPKKYWDLYDPESLPMPSYEQAPQSAPPVAMKRGGEISNYKPVPENGDVDEKLKKQLIHGYYASTSFVDAQIGKVIDELDRLGLDKNTIVVLWGDHGFHLGDHGIWTKHTNFEQATRIPLLLVAPGTVTPNSSTKQLAESVDLFPTLAELAGLPKPDGPQPINGVSLVPVLKNPASRVRDHAYHAYPKEKMGRAIRTERYRMVEWKSAKETASPAIYELYDYEVDPLEKKNVAGEQPDILKSLQAILVNYPDAVMQNKGPQISNAASAPAPAPKGKKKKEKSASKSKDFVDQVNGTAPVQAAMSPDEIKAGLDSHDRALYVKEGWIRDPYIVQGPDKWFYLTGTTFNPDDPREQTDPYNTGLGATSLVGWKAQVWRSRDLVDWESLGAPYTLKDGVWFDANPERFAAAAEGDWRLWAPELHWVGDRWALVHTSPAPVAGANLSLSRGAEIEGPWSNPMGIKIEKKHDPSLFKDDDGTWWMIWGATMVAPLKLDFSGFSAPPTEIKPSGDAARMGHEGCLIQKIHGKYVLFGTGWSTGEMRKGSYNLYYATADTITGPYSDRKFVGRFLGHGTPFQDNDKRWWCTAFYNGNVPPLPTEGIIARDLRETAQTINQRGTTLVPLDVQMRDNELLIRAKDPHYASPGPDEVQMF
jgi:iduronate 2-sulfatase